jgi:hypothetical protein
MIRSLPLGVFVLMVAFPIAMSVLAVLAGVHARRRGALIRSTPTSNIATAEQGYRLFEGRAEAVGGESLRAPLTKTPCVWYHARVEKLESDASSDTSSWRTIRDVTSDAPLMLREGFGMAAVFPYGAEVTPTDRSSWYGDRETPDDRNPPRTKPSEGTTGMLVSARTHTFRFFEERIYNGDPLVVLGVFSKRQRSEDQDDEDNEFDDEELGVAPRDDFEDEQLNARLHQRAGEITPAMITRGDGKRPLILSATPKAQHVDLSRMGGNAALGIALLPLGIAVLLLWVRFG